MAVYGAWKYQGASRTALHPEQSAIVNHTAPSFFTVTKTFHNALHRGHYELHETQREIYLNVNQQSSEQLDTD